MSLIRTPEECIDPVHFPYEPNYVGVGEPRMAYVEEGSEADRETILCLHGEPTWSFLYRKMIPTLADHGRVIAPDFVGFGYSDKYDDPSEYSFGQYYDQLSAFVETLDLRDITLVCQDWGGLLGLTLAANMPERFARLVPMNTGLPDGTQEMPDEWLAFREFIESTEDPDVGRMVQSGCATDLADDALAGYRAPFPERSHKAAVRAWPQLVPTNPEMEGTDKMSDAADRLAEWEKPAFVLFGDSDPIFRGTRDPLRERIPTATEQPDIWVENAGHFLQEDQGERIAEHIAAFIDRTDR
jgi:haloalkane dehalogenase